MIFYRDLPKQRQDDIFKGYLIATKFLTMDDSQLITRLNMFQKVVGEVDFTSVGLNEEE